MRDLNGWGSGERGRLIGLRLIETGACARRAGPRSPVSVSSRPSPKWPASSTGGSELAHGQASRPSRKPSRSRWSEAVKPVARREVRCAAEERRRSLRSRASWGAGKGYAVPPYSARPGPSNVTDREHRAIARCDLATFSLVGMLNVMAFGDSVRRTRADDGGGGVASGVVAARKSGGGVVHPSLITRRDQSSHEERGEVIST